MRAGPSSAVRGSSTTWIGMAAISSAKRPLARKAATKVPSASLPRIRGAIPPPTNTPPRASALSARLPPPAPRPGRAAQRGEQLGLEIAPRRVVGVAALGADDEVAGAVPDQQRLAEPRARRDQRHVPRAGRAPLEGRERRARGAQHAVSRGGGVVQE